MKNSTSRTIAVYAGLALAAGMLITRAYATGNADKESPNVLFIAIEDFNPEHIGCYGGQAITPNIDRLAREGVVFKNAFCDVAVCNPSRTALLTGLRPATSGVFGNADDWREKALPLAKYTLPQHFKNNGYQTVKVGKIFHYQMPHHESWNRELPGQVEGRKFLSAWHEDVVPLLNKLDEDTGDGWFNTNLHWGPVDCEPEEFRDGHYVTTVADYLAEDLDHPFFLAVGFHAPHVKFGAPKEFFDLYQLDDIVLPENPPNDLEDIPTGLSKNSIHDVIDSFQWRDIKRAQLACMSYVDWCIGGILDALKKNNLDDNTVVVIWTDHGFGLGEHFQWSKGGNKLFSEINQVGYIWKVPGITPEGAVSNSVVETIDMFPTLFELCNIEVPAHVQGESFVRLLKDPGTSGKDAAFTWGSRQRVSVQTERYRLNMDLDLDPSSFELYDHTYDPDEYINVSCNPQYGETIEKLITYYSDHQKKYRLFENE